MPGKEDFILTGQLGEVMRESARAGLSWIRAHADELGIEREVFEKYTLHIHVPAGGIPKDGPSAGITMALAMVSAFTGIPVQEGRGDDGRDHAAWSRPAHRRPEEQDPRRAPLRCRDGDPAAEEPEGPRSTSRRRSARSIKLVLVDSMDQVLEHALVRVPKRLEAKPAEVVEKGE